MGIYISGDELPNLQMHVSAEAPLDPQAPALSWAAGLDGAVSPCPLNSRPLRRQKRDSLLGR